MIHLRDQVQGKWRGILISLGVDERFLKNRHTSCPMCGGKDRFRFDDKNGRGTYFCNQCGSGDGFELAMKYTGQDFKGIARHIDSIVGTVEVAQPKPGYNKEDLKRNFGGLIKLAPNDAVNRYLRGRGLSLIAGYGLRHHPAAPYYLDSNVCYHAMIALITGPENERLGYHITYLKGDKKAPVKSPKKVFKAAESIIGGAIRLAPISEHLGITEGIENALAVMEREGLACWAAVSADMMKNIQIPNGVLKVSIFGDSDKSFTGQEAAYVLARRLKREGFEVEVRIIEGGDYLDHLIKQKRVTA